MDYPPHHDLSKPPRRVMSDAERDERDTEKMLATLDRLEAGRHEVRQRIVAAIARAVEAPPIAPT